MTANRPDDLPAWARYISPNSLFLGAVLGFAGCCLAGYLASRHNPFDEFERFHFLMSAETHYYPTANQVRELARSKLDPGKIAVIVGGSSRLHGTCQSIPFVWTRRLQDELGDEFQVLNLALRSGTTAEFAEPVAEMLYREYPRLIVVSDINPGGMSCHRPDGNLHRYFYWDAFYKGLLLPAPQRNTYLREVGGREDEVGRKAGKLLAADAELRRRMKLDAALYFTDLWNWVAYRHVFTLWDPNSQRPFTKPRWSMHDSDPGPLPVYTRFIGSDPLGQVALLRKSISGLALAEAGAGEGADDSAAPWTTFHHINLRASFPDPIRSRLVLLLPWHSRFHLNLLTPDEQVKYGRICRATVRITESEGIAALEIGAGFTIEDYADMLHFSPRGGDKMAVLVAAKVRERARALGFIPER
jgi:hypothetical protein